MSVGGRVCGPEGEMRGSRAFASAFCGRMCHHRSLHDVGLFAVVERLLLELRHLLLHLGQLKWETRDADQRTDSVGGRSEGKGQRKAIPAQAK